MKKDFCITKEFFGGIIENTCTKDNFYIDSDLFNFLNKLIDGKLDHEEIKTLNISQDELLEIFIDMIKMGLLNLNYTIYKNNKECKDYLSHPIRVFYDITYLCNLRCKHCFTNSGEKNKKELSFDQKIELVTQCKQLNVGRISIAGGEPFCDERILDFLKLCKDNQLEVSLTTNGTLLNKETVIAVNKLGIKTLTVSLDGGSEESNDIIRGKGSFKKTLEGLENLKKYYKNNYCIKTTLMKTNVDDIEKLIKIAIENKCWSIKFNCVREDGRAKTNAEGVLLNQKEYIKTIKEIELLRKKYKDCISIKAPLNIFCEDEYEFIEELGFGCFAGKESICIDPMGNVRPCSHFSEEYICGNILEKNLWEIWHESRILNRFRSLTGNDICNTCKYYKKCRGGCRYRAFRNGDINGIDPYCYLEANKHEE